MESNYEYFSHMPYKLWLNLRKNSKALLFFYLLYSLIHHRFVLSCLFTRAPQGHFWGQKQNLISSKTTPTCCPIPKLHCWDDVRLMQTEIYCSD